jgi:NACalpha-BTF3-like transcription factor
MTEAVPGVCLFLSLFFGIAPSREEDRGTQLPRGVDSSNLPLQVVGRVVDMGFSEEAARKALEESGWDETAAVNALLSS